MVREEEGQSGGGERVHDGPVGGEGRQSKDQHGLGESGHDWQKGGNYAFGRASNGTEYE